MDRSRNKSTEKGPVDQKSAACGSSPTRRELLAWATQQLKAAGVEVPRTQAVWLLTDATDSSRVEVHAYPHREVPSAAVRQFKAMVQRCLEGEPIQYVLGHHEFYGLRLRVTPAVLIPRLETEEVVEAALSLLSDRTAPRVLDAGTGSGCIACALQHERPEATVYACDISQDALAVARNNAHRHDLPIRFFDADLLAGGFAETAPSDLDLLISNPPYLLEEEADGLPGQVRDYEPGAALFAGDDPLRFYRALARHAHALLAPDAYLVAETHADYGRDVRALWERETGLRAVRLQDDLGGRARIVMARRETA